MAKKKDSVFKLVSMLVLTCVISGICLALTFSVTKDRIALAEENAKLSAVKEVLPEFEGNPVEKKIEIEGNEVSVFVGMQDGKLVGFAIPSGDVGYGGMVNVLVGFDPKGSVTGIALLDHQETPGLGSKAGEPGFIKQFFGKSDSSYAVKKDGGNIEAVTAATITSRAVCGGVTKAAKVFALAQTIKLDDVAAVKVDEVSGEAIGKNLH